MSTKSYKDAGVDIDAGNAMVAAIKPFVKATNRPGVLGSIGGFGGLFDLRKTGYTDPILVAATDGVGTKLKIAFTSGIHDSIGIDLVAMCVNDLVVQGAEPLFFLDYYATSRLEPEIGAQVVKGIATGCKAAGCALIGGETAEMPGLYAPGDYDLAGFAVGAVERDKILDGTAVREGDSILGLASSGLHSNGYSLVRKVISDVGLDYDDPTPFFPDLPLQDVLLTPTKIYVKSCLSAIQHGGVHALAHITGGGLIENLPRVNNEDLAAFLDLEAYEIPQIFSWLAKTGSIAEEEMLRTFNCGVGMVLIVSPDDEESLCEILQKNGEKVFKLGHIEKRKGQNAVRYKGFHLAKV